MQFLFHLTNPLNILFTYLTFLLLLFFSSSLNRMVMTVRRLFLIDIGKLVALSALQFVSLEFVALFAL